MSKDIIEVCVSSKRDLYRHNEEEPFAKRPVSTHSCPRPKRLLLVKQKRSALLKTNTVNEKNDEKNRCGVAGCRDGGDVKITCSDAFLDKRSVEKSRIK